MAHSRCLLHVCVGLLMLLDGHAQPSTCIWNATTLAGNGTFTVFANGQGKWATFNYPKGVAVDAKGLVYIADQSNNRIRTASPSGLVSTLAGSAAAAWADGTGVGASFNFPAAITILPSYGTIFVADTSNNRIRRLTPLGVVDTLAGGGTASLADGQGTSASFKQPRGISVDAAGAVYIADTGNNRIRRMSPSGLVITLAGTGGSFFADGAGTTTATFSYPVGVAVDGRGRVYVGDGYNNRIRLIAPDGTVTTFAGGSSPGTADGVGTLSSFYTPAHVTLAENGDLLVADCIGHRIRTITPLGQVTTIAGSSPPGTTGGFADGLGTAALFNNPFGIAGGPAGIVYVGDGYNQRIRVLACVPLTPLTPTSSPSPLPTARGSSPSQTPTASPSATLTLTTAHGSSPSQTPPTSPTSSPTSTATPTGTGTGNGETPSPTSSPTPSFTEGLTPSPTPLPTPSPSPTPTMAGDSMTPTVTPTPTTPGGGGGGGSTPSPTPTPSGTASGTATATITPSPTSSLSPGASPSTTPSGTTSTSPSSLPTTGGGGGGGGGNKTPDTATPLSPGSTAGIVIGSLVGVAAIGAGAAFLIQGNKSKSKAPIFSAGGAPAQSIEVVNNPLGGKGNSSAAPSNTAPPAPTQAPLPEGWSEMSDEVDVWYVGPTGESVWVRPT